jgi:glycosyltransferase involved in cell wall biosynthesis
VGDAGIILPSPNINKRAEALKFTIEQPNKLEDLRKKGKENSKKFTWDNVAKATLNKWLELINKYQTNVLSSIK